MTKTIVVTLLLTLGLADAAHAQTAKPASPPPQKPASPPPQKPATPPPQKPANPAPQKPAGPQARRPAPAPTERVFISAGVAAQPTTASFVDATLFPYFLESAQVEGDYDVGDGIALDIAGAVRVWKQLSVGVGLTRVTRDTDSEVTGSFPHPFFFNTSRTGTWSAEELEREETGIHISAAWPLVQGRRLNLTAFGGPSFFSYKQAVVEEVNVIQSYPFDTVDAQLTTGSIDGSQWGFHVAVDVGWFFTRNVGVGGLLRFTQATKNTQIGDGEPFDLEIGGFQGGGGVRLRF